MGVQGDGLQSGWVVMHVHVGGVDAMGWLRMYMLGECMGVVIHVNAGRGCGGGYTYMLGEGMRVVIHVHVGKRVWAWLYRLEGGYGVVIHVGGGYDRF